MDYSMSGFPILLCLLEFAQIHVLWVGDAIQPSHSLAPSSPFAFNLSQHQGLFQWVNFCITWPKYWSFSFSISLCNEYSGLISFRIDCFALLAECSLAPQFKSVNSSALSFLYSPTLTSIHDYWKTIALTSYQGNPDSSVCKESACNAGDSSLIPGWGRATGEGKGYSL